MSAGNRFGSNPEVVGKIKVYFAPKDKYFYKKNIAILEQHWHDGIPLDRNYVDESNFAKKYNN